MAEPEPQLEKSTPLVEVGIPYSPFEYDNQLPQIETQDDGSETFSRGFILRNFGRVIILFDYDPDPRTIPDRDCVILTRGGPVYVSKEERTTPQFRSQHLFEISINIADIEKEGQIDWSVSSPRFNFLANGLITGQVGKIKYPGFQDQETKKVVDILAPHDPEALKELQMVFRTKDR